METVKVYSPIEDKEIKKNLKDSTIWKSAYHVDDLILSLNTHANMYEYLIKFEGTKPIQCTKVSKYK